MKTLAQRIEDAQKNLLKLRDKLTQHVENLGDDPTDEQVAETETLSQQIESQEKGLSALQKAEAQLARSATSTALTVREQEVVPAEQQQSTTTRHQARTTPGVQDTVLSARGRPFATAGKKVTPLDCLFKAVAMDVVHFGEGRKRNILEVVKDNYGDGEIGETVRTIMAQMVTKAASVPADTVTSGWASQLVQTVIGEFIAALMPLSVYPQLASRGASFTFGRNGVISLPSRTTSTSMGGAFVAQGAPIPVKQGAFSAISLTPKKMGVITTLTREITEHSTPAIEAIVRQAILDDTAVAIDTVLLDANAATTTRPAGLKNGQTKVTASATASIVGFVADLKSLVAALITATNGNLRSPVWIMNPGDVLAASLLQTTVGDTPFREELAGGTLLGYPVVTSTTGLNDMMGIIDAADFATATGDTPNFSVSDQAVLHMEDTTPAQIGTAGTPNTVAAPVRSLWQTDSIAIRMIMDINWALRRSGGVFQWTDTMAWN